MGTCSYRVLVKVTSGDVGKEVRPGCVEVACLCPIIVTVLVTVILLEFGKRRALHQDWRRCGGGAASVAEQPRLPWSRESRVTGV